MREPEQRSNHRRKRSPTNLRKKQLERNQPFLPTNSSEEPFFDDLSESAKEVLSDYVRQEELVVTAQAKFDEESGTATVRYFGQRLGFERFRHYFEAVKVGESAANLKAIYLEHGLQRSYLLAILQELASSEAENAPTLILGCEEPELYQHPPQARYLSEVFEQLSDGNNQVLVTSHSPHFVSGEGFENVRLVHAGSAPIGSNVSCTNFATLCATIRDASGDQPSKNLDGLIARIHQSLRPHIAEMFFARIPVLVEGLEDASYITTAMHLHGKWREFRRLGCHIVPVNGKSNLMQPIAICKLLGIRKFVIYDADTNVQKECERRKHEKDNAAINSLLEIDLNAFPTEDIAGNNYAIWKTNLTQRVEVDLGDNCSIHKDSARARYSNAGKLEKHDLFIADFLSAAHKAGAKSKTLENLCDAILSFAKID